ncbi:MAG: hypothetical protein U5L09_05245 [Bacteroidales bacterium]|nr:hypothetical protein [Bacteroidales bacterium]
MAFPCDIAGKTGVIMHTKMASAVQATAITHLPQLAGLSDEHLFACETVKWRHDPFEYKEA